MIERLLGFLKLRTLPVSDATRSLEDRGFACLRGVLADGEIEALRTEVDRVFEELPPDVRIERRPEEDMAMFRYEMLNRSALCQEIVAHPTILETIEPLLGGDCHVIANTAWRNPAAQPGMEKGQFWHIDAGPHVPRPKGTQWPGEIPYPVFAIGIHILLKDQTLAEGPTGVIPGSHRSGQIAQLHSATFWTPDVAVAWPGGRGTERSRHLFYMHTQQSVSTEGVSTEGSKGSPQVAQVWTARRRKVFRSFGLSCIGISVHTEGRIFGKEPSST